MKTLKIEIRMMDFSIPGQFVRLTPEPSVLYSSPKDTKPFLPVLTWPPQWERGGANWPLIIWWWTQLSSHNSLALWEILVTYSCFKTRINKSPLKQIYLFIRKQYFFPKLGSFPLDLYIEVRNLFSKLDSTKSILSLRPIWRQCILMFPFQEEKERSLTEHRSSSSVSKKTRSKSSCFKNITGWNLHRKNRKLFLRFCFKNTYSSHAFLEIVSSW